MPKPGTLALTVVALSLFVTFQTMLPYRAGAENNRTVKLGTFLMDPMVIRDGKGQLSGPLMGITRHIAEREGWDLRLVECTFAQCLKLLEAGEIDISTPVAYTEERAKTYGYSKETLLMDWGQVYAGSSEKINSILDLEGKRVVTLRNTVFNKQFMSLLESFSIKVEFIRVDDYLDVFRYVQDGKADAMILNRLFGEKNIGKFHDVQKTAIVFQPIDIRYATLKGHNQELLDILDDHLREMKGDPLSKYHAEVNSVLGGRTDTAAIMKKIRWALAVSGGLLVLIAVMNMYLRSKVNQRTRQLSEEVAERKQAEVMLEKSLREKEVLLREVHHRVKNNMAIITSLSNLQEHSVKDEAAKGVLREGRSRIRTMALVHEQLYKSESLSNVELGDYVRRLVQNVRQSFDYGQSTEIEVDCDSVWLNIDTLIPCGLIINELLTNAIKYAYEPHQRGKIAVTFRALKEGGYRLEVRDWGRGCEPLARGEKPSTLGMQLVTSLASQIDAKVNFSCTDGVSVSVTFDPGEDEVRG